MILKIVQNLIRILLKYNILAFENSLCPSVKTNKTSKKDDGFFWIRCINVFIQMHVKYHQKIIRPDRVILRVYILNRL